MVWRVSCIPWRPHLARTLGFPGCPLSVSAHSVLMGAFPVSRTHTSGNSHVHLVSADVIYLFTSCLGTQLRVEPPLLSSQCHPSHTLSSILMHEFPHLGFHKTQPFVLSIFMGDAAYPVCSLRSLPPFPHLQLLLILFQLFLYRSGGLAHTLFPFVPCFRSCLRRQLGHADVRQCTCFATVLRLVPLVTSLVSVPCGDAWSCT